MKELKVCRRQEGKYTVALSFPDYGAFAYDGTFPYIKYALRFDSEDELLSALNDDSCEVLCISDIDCIYYGKEDVTEKYLYFIQGHGYELLDCWRKK